MRLRAMVVVAAILAAPSIGQAATFTVNSTLDAVDATPGDGICASAGAVCTLRAAIQEANALAGADTIIIPAGTYTRTIAGNNENAAATGDLDITSTVIIEGAGADVTTVNAAGLDRVFDVTAGGNATFRGLRITGGNPANNGGGIQSLGPLVVERCAVVGNTGTSGGGIRTAGANAVTITDTAISGNVATSQGGGANLQASVSQVLTNVTISGNSAVGVGGLVVFSGATLTNVTIASNTETGNLGHSFAVGSGTGVLRNTLIVSSQAGNNCFPTGTYADGGGNFAADAACGPIPATVGVRTNLGPLTVNPPGTTATHALLPGNPAIGGGVAAFCPATDQRGVSRVGVPCDSGAYQFSTPAAPTPTPAPPGPPVPPIISAFADQTLQQNSAATIPFTISGAIIAYALRTSATTSNPTLFPALASSISCDQAGRCNLQLVPADGRAGSGVVIVTVSDGTLATSASFTATVVAVRPTAPATVSAAAVGSGVTLTWTPPDTGAPMGYVLAWGTAAGASNLPVQLIGGSATRFDMLALPSGTYFLRLAAIGTGDVGPAAAEQPVVVATSASVPGPPMALETIVSADGLRAAWYAPTIGATPTLYEEQIGTALGLSDVASPTEPSLAHTERVAPGAYWVRVRATTGGAAGPWSSSVQIPIGAAACTSAPGAPILLPAMLTPGAATFTWVPGSGVAERYELRVSPGAGLPSTLVLTSAGAGTSGTWFAPAGSWSGRLIALNACGESAVSNEVQFVVQP
jgi:CSLREA domain-containing protein